MSRLSKIGIIGAGNVGSALVMELAQKNLAQQVIIAARNVADAEAAILDAASASPETAARFLAVSTLEGKFDVIVVTAGLLPHGAISQEELLSQNVQIVLDSLAKAAAKHVIVIGTPVDRLTEELSELNDFPAKSIIGFGGQLDLARLQYALIKQGISPDNAYIIGEHGPRAIPVYGGEKSYNEIQADTTSVLKKISLSGKPRNLATGVQLARLLEALAGQEQVLSVSIPSTVFGGLSITWPYVISNKGVGRQIELTDIGPRASQLFDDLLATRRKERIKSKN